MALLDRRGIKKAELVMFRVARLAAAVLSAIALDASLALAEPGSPSRTRVTIRGTGNNVAIERTQALGSKRAEEARLPARALGEAIRLKAEGADDTTLIAYLRLHQSELPPVIEAGDIRLLRKAGVGKSVTNFLATVSAVDLGPTGEGHEVVVSAAPAPDIGMPAYAVPYGYGAASGYVPAYPAFPARLAPRGFSHFRRMTFRPPPHRSRPTFGERVAASVS